MNQSETVILPNGKLIEYDILSHGSQRWIPEQILEQYIRVSLREIRKAKKKMKTAIGSRRAVSAANRRMGQEMREEAPPGTGDFDGV